MFGRTAALDAAIIHPIQPERTAISEMIDEVEASLLIAVFVFGADGAPRSGIVAIT